MNLPPGTWVLGLEKRWGCPIALVPTCVGVVVNLGSESTAAVEKKYGAGCQIVLTLDRTFVGYPTEDLKILDNLNLGACANGPPDMPAYAQNVIRALLCLLKKSAERAAAAVDLAKKIEGDLQAETVGDSIKLGLQRE